MTLHELWNRRESARLAAESAPRGTPAFEQAAHAEHQAHRAWYAAWIALRHDQRERLAEVRHG